MEVIVVLTYKRAYEEKEAVIILKFAFVPLSTVHSAACVQYTGLL